MKRMMHRYIYISRMIMLLALHQSSYVSGVCCSPCNSFHVGLYHFFIRLKRLVSTWASINADVRMFIKWLSPSLVASYMFICTSNDVSFYWLLKAEHYIMFLFLKWRSPVFEEWLFYEQEWNNDHNFICLQITFLFPCDLTFNSGNFYTSDERWWTRTMLEEL